MVSIAYRRLQQRSKRVVKTNPYPPQEPWLPYSSQKHNTTLEQYLLFYTKILESSIRIINTYNIILRQLYIPLHDNYLRYVGVEKKQGLKFINANIIQTDLIYAQIVKTKLYRLFVLKI